MHANHANLEARAPPPRMDVREEILRGVHAVRVSAALVADEPGVIAGASLLRRHAADLGLDVSRACRDGALVQPGNEIARLEGAPRQILIAEEVLIGLLAKPSGIATRAREFVLRAGDRPRIVSGGWKKMPLPLKEMIRSAIATGGAHTRIVDGPFAYLDKNYVELLGGVRECLATVAHLEGVTKVVQVKGRRRTVAQEACEAARGGAGVVFVDTGHPEDISAASAALAAAGLRDGVALAFGGSIGLDDVSLLKALDVDILDIGRQIVDAPLLDMRLDIVRTLVNGA